MILSVVIQLVIQNNRYSSDNESNYIMDQYKNKTKG